MKRVCTSIILITVLCTVFLASCQTSKKGKPLSSDAASSTNITVAEITTTRETAAALGETTTTQGREATTTASKKASVNTKAPTTTTKKPESTATPTTHTKPFKDQYSENSVVIKIKDEYVDFDKQYTAKDFPGIDIKEIEITNYEKTRSQSGYITLNKSGEAEVRKAVDTLLKNPLIKSAAFVPVCTTD